MLTNAIYLLNIDEREDLRSVPDVDIAKLVQRVERQKMKNLSEVDLRSNTFKKIDEEGIYNPGNLPFLFPTEKL